MRTRSDPGEESPKRKRSGLQPSFRLLMLLGVLLVMILAWPLLQYRPSLFQRPANPAQNQPESPAGGKVVSAAISRATGSPSPTSQTVTQTTTPALDPGTPTQTQVESSGAIADENAGVWILSVREGKDVHLFGYHPATYPLTRLTAGRSQDITPAASPDGSSIAFASDRSGQWDLYILNLQSGETKQVTDTPAYEASPSWSPDGLWLAYETYEMDNLEIYVRPVAGDQPDIRLTEDPGADFSPAWSPAGRQIAFVSDRTGENEIWVANLDQTGDGQFFNLTQNPDTDDTKPAWSPTGEMLAWASSRDGMRQVVVQRPEPQIGGTLALGSGDWPAWSPDGMQVLSRLTSPNQAYTIAYRADQPGLVSEPASLLPGPSDGLTWAAAGLPDPLPELLSNAAEGDLSPLYLLALDKSGSPGGRRGLVELDGIEAPYPQLHDMVDEAFMALRLAVSEALSWDLMASLENAFVPITIPLPPGLAEDWLLTGRAFTFITAPLDAGWLAVVREDYGQETFWRVYGRARFQDGSQGRPLNSRPWVFNPQNAPEISLYEIGGATASSVPAGFWIDLTDLAAAFGWERLPALYNWRSYFLGTRLNEFVMRDNTDWRSAMLELYPPEVLVTPTMIIPPTRTPTPTIRWWRTPTPSSTPMPPPTLTPSPRP